MPAVHAACWQAGSPQRLPCLGSECDGGVRGEFPRVHRESRVCRWFQEHALKKYQADDEALRLAPREARAAQTRQGGMDERVGGSKRAEFPCKHAT